MSQYTFSLVTNYIISFSNTHVMYHCYALLLCIIVMYYCYVSALCNYVVYRRYVTSLRNIVA